jgi:hypothetical protein
LGRQCKVCEHPERSRIELALARKVSARQIAQRFVGVSPDSVSRHRRSHMPPQLVASLMVAGKPSDIDLDKLRQSESEGLLQHLVAQRGRLYHLLDEAEDVGDLRAASSVHGRILDNLSLGAKLLGEIATHSVHVEQNLIITDQYLRLRQTLVKALRPFPDAARAVADCLRRVEVEVEQSPAPPLLGPNNADARP